MSDCDTFWLPCAALPRGSASAAATRVAHGARRARGNAHTARRAHAAR
jgi:hypothetical protein